jgi:hypothetical protein
VLEVAAGPQKKKSAAHNRGGKVYDENDAKRFQWGANWSP